MCRREGSCSAVRTCTQCFAASYARVTCEFLHGLRLRRRCRTDIYTISRGSSGVLANLIRLKRQIFVCLLPLARCVAVRANVVWNGAYTQYKAMRQKAIQCVILRQDHTRPDQFVCLELDDQLSACRVCSPTFLRPHTTTSLRWGRAATINKFPCLLAALRRLQRIHCRVGNTIQLQLICRDFMPSPLLLSFCIVVVYYCCCLFFKFL